MDSYKNVGNKILNARPTNDRTRKIMTFDLKLHNGILIRDIYVVRGTGSKEGAYTLLCSDIYRNIHGVSTSVARVVFPLKIKENLIQTLLNNKNVKVY